MGILPKNNEEKFGSISEEYYIVTEFKWFFKITIWLMGCCAIHILMENPHDMKNVLLGGVGGIIIIASFMSYKCTSTGLHRGLNFYLFSFYFKESRNWPSRWEEHPDLKIISGWWGLTGISMSSSLPLCIFYRALWTKFDELAELISFNTYIKREIRQQFIDYVDKRRQQSILSRISLIILNVAMVLVMIVIIKSFVEYRYKLLDKNGVFTNAVITEFHDPIKRSPYLNYSYFVDGVKYKYWGKWYPSKDTFLIGDTITIIFNKTNPKYSRPKRDQEEGDLVKETKLQKFFNKKNSTQ